MKSLAPVLAFLMLAAVLAAQSFTWRDADTARLVTVTTAGNVLVILGDTGTATFAATDPPPGGINTKMILLSVRAFQVARICGDTGSPSTTSAGSSFMWLQRVTMNNALATDTPAAIEATANTPQGVVSRMGGIANFPGQSIASEGTVGPFLDEFDFQDAEWGAGTADHPSRGMFCKTYGATGEKRPRVLGTAPFDAANIGTAALGLKIQLSGTTGTSSFLSVTLLLEDK